jgi:long-subunit fatty acid transport protein
MERLMRTVIGVLVLTGVFGGGSAFAQSKTGTTVAQFMGIEPSARIAAMGNAGVALFDGIQAAYYNPAAIGSVLDPAVQFTHSVWFADISYDYVAGGLPLNAGTLFASVTALNSGEIAVRTVDQPLGTGERYTVSDFALGLGFGRSITDRFGAGAQVNYINETIWHSSLNVLTFSAGTAYRLMDNGLMIGASLTNFGTKGKFNGRDLAIQYDADPSKYGDNGSLPADQATDAFPVPIRFRVGLSMPHQVTRDSAVLLVVDATHPNDNTESMSMGGEWSWKDTVALRAGYQDLFLRDSDVGLTLGVGLKGGLGETGFQFDYAWANHDRLQETHRMTFAITF